MEIYRCQGINRRNIYDKVLTETKKGISISDKWGQLFNFMAIDKVYRSFCDVSPVKFHRFYMMKPVKKYTWSDPAGSLHQYMYCRYCTQTFESIIKTEKDSLGRFKTTRTLQPIETTIIEPKIEP